MLKRSDALTTREDILPKSKSKWLSAAGDMGMEKINDGRVGWVGQFGVASD